MLLGLWRGLRTYKDRGDGWGRRAGEGGRRGEDGGGKWRLPCGKRCRFGSGFARTTVLGEVEKISCWVYRSAGRRKALSTFNAALKHSRYHFLLFPLSPSPPGFPYSYDTHHRQLMTSIKSSSSSTSPSPPDQSPFMHLVLQTPQAPLHCRPQCHKHRFSRNPRSYKTRQQVMELYSNARQIYVVLQHVERQAG